MDKQPNNTLYLIGNAHLDPVWLWQWQEGFSEIKATFQSALDRMDEYDDFIFVCAGASFYQWVEDNNPAMFERIKERVKEGRWQVVGGWHLQPDCNLPSGEAFVRHSLYSQRYYKETFGQICTTGYNVDSFGHNYTIPQILKKSGMNNYVFMRPGARETALPDPLFWWEGPDGSRVLTFRILDDHYNNSFRTLERVINDAVVKEGMNTDQMMMFYGVGNHGGGPTIQALEMIHRMQKDKGEDKLFISSPDAYFQDRREETLDYPVWTSDIQHHAPGCYSTHFEFKKQHRKVEQMLMAAERWNTLGQLALGYRNDNVKFKEAWQTVLFNQFHDIMGGCSLEASLKDAETAMSYAEHMTAQSFNGTLQSFSWAINTHIPGAKRSKEVSGRVWQFEDYGVPFVVFNPLPFDVTVPVFMDLEPERITTHDGQDVTIQKVAGRYILNKNNPGTIFMAQLPALGYTTYWLHMPKERPEYVPAKALELNTVLENEWTRLEINPDTGLITSLVDKRSDLQLIQSVGAKPIVMNENSHDTWGHGSKYFDDIIGMFQMTSIERIEDGPVRSTIRVKYEYNQSQLRQDFHLYSDSPDPVVDLRVNWQEKHRILKLDFDIKASNPMATYSMPYSHITKECTGLEEPGHMWMDLSDDQGQGAGLALATDARYSYCAACNHMRLNVVRSPIFADHEAYTIRTDDMERMDQGIHHMKYTLVPHSGCWKSSGIVQKALMLNNPAQQIHETYHEGPLPQTMRYVNISDDNVILSVLKPHEEEGSEAFVLRLYETIGQHTTTTVDIPLLNLNAEINMSAFEIKTLLVTKDGQFQEVNLLEFDE